MPRRRRARLTIMAQILDIAREGTLKTKIMYRVNLSFTQVNDYLSFLQERKLLNVKTKNEKAIYKTTPKGVKYLKTFAELKACVYATGDLMTTSNLPSFSISRRQVFIVDDTCARDRAKVYAMLREKGHSHDTTCRILALYDLGK